MSLTISRNRDETVVLIDSRTGEQVARITVADANRRVRLRFDAPEEIVIRRAETMDQDQHTEPPR